MYGPQNTTTTITRFDDFWDEFEGENEFAFLSNFYECEDELEIELPWTGRMFAMTSEHLFAAAKAKRHDERLEILNARSPGTAKGLGRRCKMVSGWTKLKLPVMRLCIEAKFPPGSKLARRLVDTFPCNLREGTQWDDRIWGVDDTDRAAPGQNLLGMLLMDHRSRLMDGLPAIGFIKIG